ncbi:MAG: sel1 repeat family protein, partial [Clostridia bacterium]|nr:sel1 repeat family protein [Clostridia bacterium]
LAICYEDGVGVEIDVEKAAYWYKRAAEQGEERAQFNIAVCYENGLGVKKDLEKAVKWYKKAAEQDDEDAEKALERLNKS